MSTSKLAIQRIENAHILFWLLKDISWCLVWRPLGVTMIIPTLSIAILITYHYRKNRSDLVTNSAVVLWILANSTWMLTEFFGMEDNFLATGLPGKAFATVFFASGILLIIVYYTYSAIKPQTQLKP